MSLGAYTGKINATCDASALSGAMCTLTPSNPISVPSGGSANLTAIINVPSNASPGAYPIKVNAQDTTGLAHSASISLTIGQHFLVTTSTPSQTVTAGQTSGPYALRVQPVGSSFDGVVTLACTAGLPSGAQCVFNPSTPVTPGNSAVDVVMNISTRASAARSQAPAMRVPAALWLPIVVTVLGWGAFGKHDRKAPRQALSAVVFCFAMMGLVSCAGVSQGGDGGGQPPPPVTYHITITGTSPGTPPAAGRSTTVALVVN